jgi:hypothetical protein
MWRKSKSKGLGCCEIRFNKRCASHEKAVSLRRPLFVLLGRLTGLLEGIGNGRKIWDARRFDDHGRTSCGNGAI